jgi:hypothetical protein
VEDEERSALDPRYRIAFALLAVFIVAATVGGALVGAGVGAGWGFVGLSLSSGVVAILLGAD